MSALPGECVLLYLHVRDKCCYGWNFCRYNRRHAPFGP